MTSISHQPSTFHYIELKPSTTTSSSSSSSLLSTSSTSSSTNPICKVTNSPCIESPSSEKQRKKKRSSRSTTYLQLKLPDFPVKTQCPNCRKYVVTHVIYRNGTCVYVFAMGLFALTGVLFWVPFFMDCCKDVTHFCPNCKHILGTRKRI